MILQQARRQASSSSNFKGRFWQSPNKSTYFFGTSFLICLICLGTAAVKSRNDLLLNKCCFQNVWDLILTKLSRHHCSTTKTDLGFTPEAERFVMFLTDKNSPTKILLGSCVLRATLLKRLFQRAARYCLRNNWFLTPRKKLLLLCCPSDNQKY